MRKSCARAAAFIRKTFSFVLATAEARVPPMQLRGGGATQDGILASEIAHGIDCQCYFSDNFFVPNRGFGQRPCAVACRLRPVSGMKPE